MSCNQLCPHKDFLPSQRKIILHYLYMWVKPLPPKSFVCEWISVPTCPDLSHSFWILARNILHSWRWQRYFLIVYVTDLASFHFWNSAISSIKLVIHVHMHSVTQKHSTLYPDLVNPTDCKLNNLIFEF